MIWRKPANITDLITYCSKLSTIDGAQWHILGTTFIVSGNAVLETTYQLLVITACVSRPKILILSNYVLMLYWYISRKNQGCYKNTCCAGAGLTVALLVMVAAENHFYFRHESLIEYDREKMRVWGRWCLQILPNNQEDASDQPVSPSCACYFISFIFLVNFTWMKVCGWGCLINLALRMKRNYHKQQCHPQIVLAWIPMHSKKRASKKRNGSNFPFGRVLLICI